MRIFLAACLTLAMIASAPRATRAQGATTPPPVRLPSASPPVPPPVRDSAVRATAPALSPPRPAAPPAPAPRVTVAPAGAAAAAIAAPPADASMRCKDGAWLTGARDAERCRERGGVAVILPVQMAPPPAAPPRP